MIFVQIAAYRDPELLPTIKDCIEQAKYKSDLTFGICWQKAPDDRCLDAFADNPKFRIESIPWQESRGLGWARSRIQKLHEGEEFTMQLDSHHRFEHHWDEKLLKYMELTGSAKPLITAYAGVYDPVLNKKNNIDPYKMVGEGFTPSGTILFRPQSIERWQELSRPIRARFVSGHFFFTLGAHCEEYKYDPDIYFAGDEISLSIRSFTLGYDLFHPHRTVVWHEYTRQGRVKHWDDHTVKNKDQVELAWHERDVVSKRRLRKMLREEVNDADITGFDLGTVRTHREYELYAGIDFARRRLHKDVMAGVEPPCTYVDEKQWEEQFVSKFDLTLNWVLSDIEKCDDYKFIYFGVEDRSGNVVYRYDASPESPEGQFLSNRKSVTFSAAQKPVKLVVWPVSHSRGWLRKVEYAL